MTFGSFSARLHRIFGLTLVSLSAFNLPLVYAGSVTIHVKDGSGTAVQNAIIYAIVNGDHGPDGTESKVGVSDSSGNATFSLNDAKSYEMIADKDGLGPTARSQFFSPSHLHLNGNANGTSDITLNQTFTGRGVITLSVTHATANKFVVSSVRKKSSGSDVGFAAQTTDGSGAASLVFNNIPVAAADIYEVSVFDPSGLNGQGQGNSATVGAVSAGVSTPVSIDVSAGLPPDLSANPGDGNNNTGPSTGATVRGVLEDSAHPEKIIPFSFIQLSVVESGNVRFVSGAPVDQNGRYEIRGLAAGTYYVQTPGGCNQNTGLCYSGYENTTIRTDSPTPGANDIVINSGDADTKATVTVHTKLAQTPEGTGTLKIKVKNDSGVLIPGANVNVNGDGSRWKTTVGAPVCNGTDPAESHQAFYQQNKQATTGSATFEKIPGGNVMISVWTPFSRNSTVYNAGPDATWAWDSGVRGCSDDSEDDFRVYVSSDDDSVTVYNAAGAAQAAEVVDESGVPTITVVVPTSAGGDGTLHVVANFSEAVNLTEPITFVLSNCGENGCDGNFGTIIGNGTAKKTYTVDIAVPTTKGSDPASYFMDVRSKYWGVVREGGGNDQITFKGVTSLTKTLKFAPAGRVIGKLYKPDGTLFIPQNSGSNYLSGGVNAQGNNNWGNAQVNDDGSFTIGGLIPGKYSLVPQMFGGNADVTYAPKTNLDEVVVTANTDAEKNVSFVNGVIVAPAVDIGNLPNLHMTFEDHRTTSETYEVFRLKAGIPLSPDMLRGILVHQDERSTFQYRPAGVNQCEGGGGPWAGGFCPQYLASNDAYNFYLTRRGDIDAGFHQFMTFYDSKENVAVAESARSTPAISFNNQSIQPVHVDFTTTVANDGVSVSGTVIASNMLRAADFAKFGGDFGNFIKYIPLIVAKKQSTDKILAVGLVTPPPAVISGAVGDQIDAAVAHNDYAAFKALVDGQVWGYEMRGLPADTDIILCGTTPNYPAAYKRIHTGAAGSSSIWNINWDTQVGSGGTITGTVTDSNGDPIASASVELRAPGLPAKTVTTNDVGVYIQPGLPQGPYKVTASATDKAPAAKRDVISANETDTLDFQLVNGPGSITGTVTRMSATSSGIVNKPVEGATIIAYDDTQNAADSETPLALVRTKTASDGTYTLQGFIATHSIVITCRTDDNYPARQTVTATGGAVTGADFKLQPKPLDVDLDVAFDKNTDQFVFRIKNPKNFETGSVWYYNSANAFDVSTATDITSDFNQLPDGSLVARLASSALTAGVTYKLHIVATPADGSPDVTKEVTFSLEIKNNSLVSIDNAMLGDDTENNGVASNKVSGADGSSIEFEPGAVLPGSGDEIQSAQIAQQPAETDSGDVVIVGNPSGVSMNNVNFTDRPLPFEITFDGSTVEDITNLALYRQDPDTGKWELVTRDISVDPVGGTVSGFVPFGDVASSEIQLQAGRIGTSGVRSRNVPGQMKALKTAKGYRTNPRAMATGTAIFAVGVAQVGGVSAVGYHQYNFPNPFNLKQKTVTLRSGTSGVGTSIRGTYIVVAPTGSGSTNIKIKIYNVAGDMVREFNTPGTRGQYNYTEWDGKNTAGDDVASGVYFAVVDAPGAPKKEPIKMVVVK